MIKLQTQQKFQNRAARIVTKSSFKIPSMALIQSLNGLVPEYLSNLFERNSTRNVRELRNTETELSISLRKTNNGQRAISFHGPELDNLELDVQ